MGRKKKEEVKAYTVNVIGEAESPFRGAVPETIEGLIEKPSKDVASLIYQAVKAQVELCTQAGDVAGAWDAIKRYQEEQFQYSCPLNVFKRDHQNGNWPFQGAHTVYGAFRDAARFVFPEYFYEKGAKGGTKRPSKSHLIKFVKVRPYHIFFHRPDISNGVVKKPDGVEGQQPSTEVKGFARYEVINDPFQFQFKVAINPKGLFKDFLSDKERVVEAIYQAANHGLGASRGAGYGMWRVVDLAIEEAAC